MTVPQATRWRVAQLLVFGLAGAGLVGTHVYAPSVDPLAKEPLLLALGAVLVGYAAIAAVWEALLAAKTALLTSDRE